MADEHQIKDITADILVPEAVKVKHDGYRLVQICGTRKEQGFELLYTFGKETDLLSLRFSVDENTEIMSISDVFAPAFLYENEIHDLFGLKVNLMSIDYMGNFYRSDVKTPFR